MGDKLTQRNSRISIQEMRLILGIAFLLLSALAPWRVLAQTKSKPPVIRPKVIVVVYFEVGKDTGDTPGELQFWVERDRLDRVIDVRGMSRAIRANADGSEIAMAVGPGTFGPA